jgi:enamine deaminase RidA (YjgF/YER057c/UK114 family)
MKNVVTPPGWPRPRGYANGIVATGKTLFVAGLIGWNEREEMASGFVAQFRQALDNVVTVVRAAGGRPEDIVRMTTYVTDLDAYRSSLSEVGAAWREVMGKHYPAMALVGVAGLVHPQALVEIEATAVLEEKP